MSAATKRKISAFTDVSVKAVISAITAPDIYLVPMEMEKEGLAEVITEQLHLKAREPENSWYTLISRERTARVTIAIVSKYGIEDVYISIKESLKHAGFSLSTEVDIRWLDAETFSCSELADVDGVLVPGGFGNRGIEGKIRAIEYARTHKKPYLGLCLGFQLAVIEYARNVVGISDATSEEMGPGSHVIAILPEQEEVENMGGTMRLGNCTAELRRGTRVHALYGTDTITERHRHRYEVKPEYIERLEEAGLIFSGRCGPRMEVCELSQEAFFLATQFHPEFKSTPTHPSPPYVGFVQACRKQKLQNKV